ncbi:MAG: hypothetical protein ACFCAD_25175 [Pleurocapsa sp.]
MKNKFIKSIHQWGCLTTIIVLPLASVSLIPLTTQDSATFTVQKLERVTNTDGKGSKYLVFTENETFKNTDELILFKFNSSDVHGMMKEGETYKAEVIGTRVPFLSWYRNIISVEELDRKH